MQDMLRVITKPDIPAEYYKDHPIKNDEDSQDEEDDQDYLKDDSTDSDEDEIDSESLDDIEE